MKYLVTKHHYVNGSFTGHALFGRVVDDNQSIHPEWHGVTAFVLDKDKELITAHHQTFCPDLEIVWDTDVITSR